jgi:hypothetical protein
MVVASLAKTGWTGPKSLGEGDRDAAVLAALLFDLADLDRADLGGAGDMGAAAGLQVDLVGARFRSAPDAPGPARWAGGPTWS